MNYGLDISAFQAGLSMQSVKNAGKSFVILRGGFTGWGTGVDYVKDGSFETFYSQAKSVGLNVGCYWYSCANTRDKGIAEANFLYNNCLKGKQFEYPIYLDVEDDHHQKNNGAGTTDAIIGFCETLEAKGYYVGIYASYYWFNSIIQTNRLNAYDKWLAYWTNNKPNTTFGYNLWQNSSSGVVAGHRVDTDVSFIDFPSIIKNKGLNGYSKDTPVEPTPVTPTKSVDELAEEVIAGKWGNGEDRKQRLAAAGYDYAAVQAKVNELMAKPSAGRLDLVKKTIRGDFGNGEARKNALGNNYAEVQRQVELNLANGTTSWNNIKLY